MSSITTFIIDIPEDRIQRLKQKLDLTDFPDEVSDLNPVQKWSRGTPLAEIKRVAKYWQHEFEWRKVEAKLNKIPQYIASIEVDGFGGYDVHFVHQRSIISKGIPLLFLHGWPGSFIEVTKILPQLVQGNNSSPAFHVVAPSLIDFGFSSASNKKAFHVDQHAEIYHKLMLALGYDQYVIQGGDLGCLIGRTMAARYGKAHCKALHTNSAVPAEPNSESYPDLYKKIQATALSKDEKAGLGTTALFFKEGNGYYQELAYRPQTIAYSLTDSPVGLLAWFYEKLHDWTDNYPWTDDEILTWVCIHYFSRPGPGAHGSAYYGLEHRKPGAFVASQAFIDVPLGVARFAKDLILLPKLWNHTLGPIVLESDHAKGGHFAAWECPDDIVSDLRRMFGRGGGAAGCVDGNDGYELSVT